MNVSLLYSNHRHVSATLVDIFRVARARIQSPLECVGINSKFKISYNFAAIHSWKDILRINIKYWEIKDCCTGLQCFG